MTFFVDEKTQIVGMSKTSASGKSSTYFLELVDSTLVERFLNNPIFTLVIYRYDQITKVKIGCDRFSNGRLLQAKNNTIKISLEYDRFYNNSEQAYIRADKIDAFGNQK